MVSLLLSSSAGLLLMSPPSLSLSLLLSLPPLPPQDQGWSVNDMWAVNKEKVCSEPLS